MWLRAFLLFFTAAIFPLRTNGEPASGHVLSAEATIQALSASEHVRVKLTLTNSMQNALCISVDEVPTNEGITGESRLDLSDNLNRSVRFVAPLAEPEIPTRLYYILVPKTSYVFVYDLSAMYALEGGRSYKFNISVPAVNCTVFERGYLFPPGAQTSGAPSAQLTQAETYVFRTGELSFDLGKSTGP